VVHIGFDDAPQLSKTAGSGEEALEHYRRVRDEIREFVATKLRAILSTPGSTRRAAAQDANCRDNNGS
jgi:arsenate reductase